MPRPVLLRGTGTSFVGTSPLAREIAERFRYLDADVDETNVTLCVDGILDHELGRKLGADPLTVYGDTLESVTRGRLPANRRSPTRRDVTDDDLAAILAASSPPTAEESPLVFPFGEDADAWMTTTGTGDRVWSARSG